MYYFTPDVIAQAYKNINNLDSKAGGLFCVLSCLNGKIEENRSYTIDGGKLRSQLSFVFDKVPKESFDNFKPSHIIFAIDWPATFFKKFIKNKIDVLSCAVFFLRRYGFDQELTNEEVIDIFIKRFNLECIKDSWFLNENNLQLAYNQLNPEDNQAIFYKEMNYNNDFKSLLFNNVIQKSAADLKAAGQIQTLYSGSGVQSCFLLSDEPLEHYYVMVSSKQVNGIEDGMDNEYIRAAQAINDFILETGYGFEKTEDELNGLIAEFNAKFSPEKLMQYSDDELMKVMFYTKEQTNDSMCYWLEFNKEMRSQFGSIAGGSSLKFGIFQNKEGEWVTGSPAKMEFVSYEDALEIGKQIRDRLVKGADIIRSAQLNTVEDYEKLHDTLITELGTTASNGWVHKYFYMIFPDKFVTMHSEDWQKHILRALQINPSSKAYGRSGQLAIVAKYAKRMATHMFQATYSMFGGIKKFYRLGTSDNDDNFADEWKSKGIVGIGWPALGSLEQFTNGGKDIEKSVLAAKLVDLYYHDDTSVATRKAGELQTFYRTDEDSVFVLMAGQKLIALADKLGEYSFDSDNASTPNKK